MRRLNRTIAFLLYVGLAASLKGQNQDNADRVAAMRARMEAAASRQRDSVAAMQQAAARTRAAAERHKESPNAGFFSTPGFPPLPAGMPSLGCDPLPQGEIASLVDSASASTTVEPDLIREVMKKESGFYPCAISAKGAQGLMQLMPGTAEELGVPDPFSPAENVLGGAKLLRQLLDHYDGNLGLVLGAYNAGPAAVDTTMSVPDFPETTTYVRDLLSRLLPATRPAQQPPAGESGLTDVSADPAPADPASGETGPSHRTDAPQNKP